MAGHFVRWVREANQAHEAMKTDREKSEWEMAAEAMALWLGSSMVVILLMLFIAEFFA